MDDFLSCEKSWIGNAYRIFGQTKQHSVIHAQKCEDVFKTVKSNAEAVGMRVNEKKTKLLCISPATGTEVSSYIRLNDGTKITSQPELKQLGFTFSARPTVDLHLDRTAKKFRARLWFIRHLKKAAVNKDDLLHVYKCFLLPIVDYASVVYHSLLTKQQAGELERLQSSALKIIYGWSDSYSSILQQTGLESLAERRQRLTDKFIVKAATNPKFKEAWFPTKTFVHHDLRKEKIYQEFFAKTERLYNAPLYYYRRRLNEIHTPE